MKYMGRVSRQVLTACNSTCTMKSYWELLGNKDDCHCGIGMLIGMTIGIHYKLFRLCCSMLGI